MKNEEYLNTKETKAILKIDDCKLSHFRIQGKLKFIKKGNAFLYLKSSIDDLLLLINKGNKQ